LGAAGLGFVEILHGGWGRPPRAPDVEPPVLLFLVASVFFFLLCLFVFFSTGCINLATILWEAIPR